VRRADVALPDGGSPDADEGSGSRPAGFTVGLLRVLSSTAGGVEAKKRSMESTSRAPEPTESSRLTGREVGALRMLPRL